MCNVYYGIAKLVLNVKCSSLFLYSQLLASHSNNLYYIHRKAYLKQVLFKKFRLITYYDFLVYFSICNSAYIYFLPYLFCSFFISMLIVKEIALENLCSVHTHKQWPLPTVFHQINRQTIHCLHFPYYNIELEYINNIYSWYD